MKLVNARNIYLIIHLPNWTLHWSKKSILFTINTKKNESDGTNSIDGTSIKSFHLGPSEQTLRFIQSKKTFYVSNFKCDLKDLF